MDDVGHSLLSKTTSLVDVLEGIEFFGALMLDNPHLLEKIISQEETMGSNGR